MMKVVQFGRYGGPEVLELAEAPLPEPAEGQARVRVRAAAVNPADHKWRQGMFQSFAPLKLPHVVGYDVAGEVDALGGSASPASAGSRVVVMLTAVTKGGYAEFALAPTDDLVAIPDGLDFATAAAIPTAGLTGVQMVEEHIDAQRGQVVLLTGATGQVGRFSLHAAKARGARVIAAVRASQAEEARALGADDVVVLGQREWTAPLFDHVVDTVGGPDVAVLCRSLAAGGKIITAATTPIDPEGLSAVPEFIAVHSDPARLRDLLALVVAGEVPVSIARLMPLHQAAEAQQLVEAGGVKGKIILEP